MIAWVALLLAVDRHVVVVAAADLCSELEKHKIWEVMPNTNLIPSVQALELEHPLKVPIVLGLMGDHYIYMDHTRHHPVPMVLAFSQEAVEEELLLACQQTNVRFAS